MRYFKKMVGKKCYLSPLNSADAPLFTQWLNDLEVVQYLDIRRQNISLHGEEAALAMLAQEHVYAIIDLETDKVIGDVGLQAMDAANRAAEMGIFIGDKAYWGRGYGADAMEALAGYAFDFLGIHNIMLRVAAFNTRAVVCYRKVGFKENGRRREALYFSGQYHDIIFMDLLEQEFRAAASGK